MSDPKIVVSIPDEDNVMYINSNDLADITGIPPEDENVLVQIPVFHDSQSLWDWLRKDDDAG